MKIGNPIKVDPSRLKVGDKLRVKKEAYRAKDPNDPYNPVYCNTKEECEAVDPRPNAYSLVNVGDVYTVTEIYPTLTPIRIYLVCRETGEDIGPKTALDLINFEVFELADIKEMKIGNPIKVDPRRLKVGDKLRVKKEVYRASNPDNPTGPSVYFNTAEEADALEPRGNRLSYIDVGDIYIVVGTDFRDPNKPKIYLECREIGDDIGPTTALRLINFGAFEPA